MPDQTAMLLTQQEWEDLSAMCQAFVLERSEADYDPGVYNRRRMLADRIIDAAED